MKADARFHQAILNLVAMCVCHQRRRVELVCHARPVDRGAQVDAVDEVRSPMFALLAPASGVTAVPSHHTGCGACTLMWCGVVVALTELCVLCATPGWKDASTCCGV